MEFTLEEDKYPTIPEDEVLPAKVEAVERRETPWPIDENDPTKGNREEVSFRFRVTSGEYEGRVIFGNTPVWFDASPECRLRVWVEEILGVDELSVGFKFNTDDLIDLPVNVVMGVGKKKGKNFVADVVRQGAAVASAAQPAMAAAPAAAPAMPAFEVEEDPF